MKSILLLSLFTLCSFAAFSQIELHKDSKTGKFGFTNSEGEWAIQPQFEEGEDFLDYEFAFVKKGGKWGVINRQGETILPFEYDKPSYGDYDDAIRHVSKNKKHGAIDLKEGKETIACEYDEKLRFMEELFSETVTPILVVKKGKAGLINQRGEEIIPCVYDNGEWPFSITEMGQIRATQDKKTGILDKKGNLLVPFKYDYADHNMGYDTVLYDIRIKSKYGLYSSDKKKEIVPALYDRVISYEDSDYALVSKKKKYGVLDKEGKEVVLCTLSMTDAYEAMEKLTGKTEQ